MWQRWISGLDHVLLPISGTATASSLFVYEATSGSVKERVHLRQV